MSDDDRQRPTGLADQFAEANAANARFARAYLHAVHGIAISVLARMCRGR